MLRKTLPSLNSLSSSSGRKLQQLRGISALQATANSFADLRVDFRKRLGVGGFGSVYPAKHSQTQAELAVKTVLPPPTAEPWGGQKDLADAIGNEQVAYTCMLQAGTSHPHVMDSVAHFQSTGQEASEHGLLLPSWLQTADQDPELQLNHFVMERIQGMCLEKYIQMSGCMPETEVRQITIALGQGIQYLHDIGIVHRDIKPSNVLYSERAGSLSRGYWKIIDFSAAATLGDVPSESVAITNMAGTPGYIAPEIMRKEPYGPKADIFSLGCTVHAMLAKMYLPRRHPAVGIITNLPPGLSTKCSEFVELLVSADPAHRPSIAEVLEHPWLQGISA